MKKIKHHAIRIFPFLLGAGLVAYTVWLWIGNLPVTPYLIHVSRIALILCAIVGLLLILAAVRPSMLPQNRRSIAVIGLIIIMLAQQHLADDPSRYVYLRDIMKVIGVFLLIVGPMKLLIPKDVQQELAEKDVEIIEA